MTVLIGLPIALDPDTVVQFTRTVDNRTVPYRVAVCLEHAECPVLFYDGDDCGPHFRWATAADLDHLTATT